MYTQIVICAQKCKYRILEQNYNEGVIQSDKVRENISES